MTNEKMNQMIELAWKKYADSHYIPGNPNGKLLSEQLASVRPMIHNRETFRKEIIKNPSFASQWGLKIEERELSLKERTELLKDRSDFKRDFYDRNGRLIIEEKIVLDESNIPTKLITITYNNETIESYE